MLELDFGCRGTDTIPQSIRGQMFVQNTFLKKIREVLTVRLTSACNTLIFSVDF